MPRAGAGVSILRSSARGQDCTVGIVGICNHDPETVVLAHLPFLLPGSSGMGMKCPDYQACFACFDCHRWLDGGSFSDYHEGDRIQYAAAAMLRTWRRWQEMGIDPFHGVPMSKSEMRGFG